MQHRILQHEYRSSLYKLQDRLKEFRRSHGWGSGRKPFLLELLNPCIIWPVIKQVSILTSMIKNKYTRSADRILLMLIDPSWGTVDEISNASYIYYPHQKSQQQHCCHYCFRLISTKFRPNSVLLINRSYLQSSQFSFYQKKSKCTQFNFISE